MLLNAAKLHNFLQQQEESQNPNLNISPKIAKKHEPRGEGARLIKKT
jgi:hypothetical protein